MAAPTRQAVRPHSRSHPPRQASWLLAPGLSSATFDFPQAVQDTRHVLVRSVTDSQLLAMLQQGPLTVHAYSCTSYDATWDTVYLHAVVHHPALGWAATWIRQDLGTTADGLLRDDHHALIRATLPQLLAEPGARPPACPPDPDTGRGTHLSHLLHAALADLSPPNARNNYFPN